MAEVYEASDETKRIIADWANAPFDSSKKAQMPDQWFFKQSKEYREQFELADRKRNTAAWEEAARVRAHLRNTRIGEKTVLKPARSLTKVEVDITLPEGDEHFYVAKIEGNTNVTGYGYSKNFEHRGKEHVWNVRKNGSEITAWNLFGFQRTEAKAVERIVIMRFPLDHCTIQGFVKECTCLDRYEEVVDFVSDLQAFLREPIEPQVSTVH